MSEIVERVKRILLVPREEWPVIAAAPETTAGLFQRYVMIVAAIPAIAGFIKLSVIGTSVPLTGMTFRVGLNSGLIGSALQYALSLVSVYVLALIVNALAPTFGGRKDSVQALKVVAYAYTASWVAGAAVLLPWVGWLIGLLGGAYSIYLLHLGLPILMQCGPDKATAYTVATVFIAIVLSIVMGILVSGIIGAPSMDSIARQGAGDIEITTDDGSVKIDGDSVMGRIGQMAQQMEAAGEKMEAAQKSGDSAAQSEALGQALGALVGAGSSGVEALSPEQLKPFVPESLGGLARTTYKVERTDMMGLQVATGSASYGDDSADRKLDLEITDMGGASSMALLAGWALVETESESSEGYERVYREDGARVHETWNEAGRTGSYERIVADRFLVALEGRGLDMSALKSAAESLDLSGLAALKESGRKPE